MFCPSLGMILTKMYAIPYATDYQTGYVLWPVFFKDTLLIAEKSDNELGCLATLRIILFLKFKTKNLRMKSIKMKFILTDRQIKLILLDRHVLKTDYIEGCTAHVLKNDTGLSFVLSHAT